MRLKYTILFLITLLLCVGIASAVELPLQGTVLNSTSQDLTTGDLRVTIYNSTNDLIYDSLAIFNTSITNGSYSVVLGRTGPVLNLVHGATYYLDLAVNGEDLDFGSNQNQSFTSPVGTYTDTDTDTTYAADNIYLYDNGSNIFFLNETTLNNSINALDDDTIYNAIMSYVYLNASNYFLFNESMLNTTIDAKITLAGDNDTTYTADESYINLVGGVFLLNETELNNTITAHPGGSADGTGSWTNDSTWTNTTKHVNVTGNVTVGALCLGGTCEVSWPSGFADTQKNASGYLYNDTDTIFLNEALLNATIDAKITLAGDNDTTYTADESYINLVGGVFLLNETELNNTITAHPGGSADGTGDWDNSTMGWTNTTESVAIDGNIVGTGNVTTVGAFFTWVGQALQRVTNIFAVNVDVNGTLNVTGAIELNGTPIADWTDLPSGSADGTGSWTNDSTWTNTTKHVNVSGNVTAAALCLGGTCESTWPADADTTYDALVDYVYLNGSNYFLFNESMLNTTIDVKIAAAGDNDTTYAGDEVYINLTGTTFNLKETKLNATIDTKISAASLSASGWLNGSGWTNTSLNVNVSGMLNVSNLCIGNTCETSWPVDVDTDTQASWDNATTGWTNTTNNVSINTLLELTEISTIPGAGSCSTGGQVLMYDDGASTYPCFCNTTHWVKFENYTSTC